MVSELWQFTFIEFLKSNPVNIVATPSVAPGSLLNTASVPLGCSDVEAPIRARYMQGFVHAKTY